MSKNSHDLCYKLLMVYNKFDEYKNQVKFSEIKLLLSTIDNYVVEKDLEVEVRFDIIAIIHQKKETKIEHLEDAFFHFL